MLLLSKILIWYLTIGIAVVVLFHNQIMISTDLTKDKMEKEGGIKKSRDYWLRTTIIIYSLFWPIIMYKVIKRMDGDN